MTVRDVMEKLNCKLLTGESGLSNPVTGGYCGDLLSWVMGRATEGDAWITVMGNLNAVAVAVLADVACIILADGAPLDSDAEKKAGEQRVAILQSEDNSYELAVKLSKMLGE